MNTTMFYTKCGDACGKDDCKFRTPDCHGLNGRQCYSCRNWIDTEPNVKGHCFIHGDVETNHGCCGLFEKIEFKGCIMCGIHEHADGSIDCVITKTGGTCEECMEALEIQQKYLESKEGMRYDAV